ncbi:hypothetical protein DFH06DRAFT_1467857 [Mycena polygramma]|nr:hypothetical protein DFH06DRAFT_1467857 [Mycena polygramma]
MATGIPFVNDIDTDDDDYSDDTPPTSSEPTAARAADRARIAELDTRMMELEASLAALKQEKRLVQDRLAAYKYPICRRWRDIALATPGLWRAISFSLWNPKRHEQALRLLELSLYRSGSYLLSIELKDHHAVDMYQFCRTIAKQRARWEHLALCIERPLSDLPTGDIPLPFLRTLKLGWSAPYSTATTFLAAPLLQKVSIKGYLDTYGSIFPWSQITVLSVQRISIEECADLLPQLVNIVRCRLDVQSAADRPSWNVTLTHLETLILNSPSESMQRDMLATLTLPALRRIHLSEGLLNYTDPLTELVSRSGCSLQELCIPHTGYISRRMCLAAFPSTAIFYSPEDKLAIEDRVLEESEGSEESDDADSSEEEY